MQRHTEPVQRRLMEAEALNAVLALCGSHIKQPQGAAPLNALRVSALKPHAVKPKSDCQKDHSLHPCCCTPARFPHTNQEFLRDQLESLNWLGLCNNSAHLFPGTGGRLSVSINAMHLRELV